MTTYLLVQTELGRVEEVARVVRELPDIVHAEVVGGPYDIVAIVETNDRYLGDGTRAAQATRATPGVLHALECRIVKDHAARVA
jgi:hypothetical protein